MNQAILDRLASEIAHHQTMAAGSPDRHLRIGALLRLIKDIERLVGSLSASRRTVTPLLRDGALQRLGELLSPTGIEQLAGLVTWGVSDEAIDDLNAWRGRGTITAFDGLTRGARQKVAAEIGPDLMVALLQAFAEPLRRLLRLEKSHRGGRPQDLYRNHVVQELAIAWHKATGRPAPGGKTGPFIDQCREALKALQLKTDGLEDCVRATTRRLRQQAAPKGQNPS